MRRILAITILFLCFIMQAAGVAQEVVNMTDRYHWDTDAYLDDEETLTALHWYNEKDEREDSASSIAKKLMLIQWGEKPILLLYNLLGETVVEHNYSIDSMYIYYDFLSAYDWTRVNAKYSFYIFNNYSEDIIRIYEDLLENKGQKYRSEHEKMWVEMDKILREEVTRALSLIEER